jgi:hypothetical protein
VQINRITNAADQAKGLLPASIQAAESDRDDIERITTAIRLLRQNQLQRADVQAKVAEIFEKRIFRGGRR